MIDWQKRPVLVTGGASFIGSHLVDALLLAGAHVTVVDNFSSGQRANLPSSPALRVITGDLLEPVVADTAVKEQEIVFHLAADHGGRGYVDMHQVACSRNLALDANVFAACAKEKVKKVVYASSGCVYPNHLQGDVKHTLYLKENMVGPPYDADNLYGWAKLMGEMTLRAYHHEQGMGAACCRYFTVYGPRGHENHAIIAMIARSFVDQDPFVVWGDGSQIRNWTYVDDIVRGTMLAAERIEDGSAVNLGTTERVRVVDAVLAVLRVTGKTHLPIAFHPEMPVGPLNRVADNTLCAKVLGWQPNVSLAEGLGRTIDWYYKTKDREAVIATLAERLTGR